MIETRDILIATRPYILGWIDEKVAAAGGGDITGVTASTGLTGGGTSGAVSLAIAAGGVADDMLANPKVNKAGDTLTGALERASLATGNVVGTVLKVDTWNVSQPGGQRQSLIDLRWNNTGAGAINGIRIEGGADTLDTDAQIALGNLGNSDSIYMNVAGKATGATTPTGIGVDLNRNGLNENNNNGYAGLGVQVYDWSSTNRGVDAAKLIYLWKVNNADSDHPMIEARGNRNALRMITQGTPTDGQQPMISLWRGSDGVLLWKAKANGEWSLTAGLGMYWEMPGGFGGVIGTSANQLDLRAGTAGLRVLNQAASTALLDITPTSTTINTAAATINGGVQAQSLTVNNGNADGGDIILASQGFDSWSLDNASGTMRAHKAGTVHLQLSIVGSLVQGAGAIATNATDGFLYVASMAGTPSGTPTVWTGRAPLTIDTTNHKLYYYSGAWRDASIPPDGSVTAAKLASGAAVSNIGYTPVNKAGDTMTGALTVPSLTSNGDATISAAGSSVNSPRLVGFSNMTEGTAVRMQFGDEYNAFSVKHGGRLSLWGYWGLHLSGNRQGTAFTLPTGGATDDGVLIEGVQGGVPTLGVRASSTQLSGTGIFEVRKSDDTVLFRVDGAGDVGIKSASTTEALTVGGAAVADTKLEVNAGGDNHASLRLRGYRQWLIQATSNAGASGAIRLWDETSGGERLRVDAAGNFVLNSAALATNSTDGFLYLASMAGNPSGTPTSYTGRVPVTVDTTNNRLYVYVGGAWRYAALT